MSKRLRTVVLVDSSGMASHSVRESWHRLCIANPLRVFSSCPEALAFVRRDPSTVPGETSSEVGAVVLDHSAREEDGRQLLDYLRGTFTPAEVPVLVYAADLKPLREDSEISADAFVRRPMALKLIHELDTLCGLSRTHQTPTAGLDAPAKAEVSGRQTEQSRKEAASTTQTHSPDPCCQEASVRTSEGGMSNV